MRTAGRGRCQLCRTPKRFTKHTPSSRKTCSIGDQHVPGVCNGPRVGSRSEKHAGVVHHVERGASERDQGCRPRSSDISMQSHGVMAPSTCPLQSREGRSARQPGAEAFVHVVAVVAPPAPVVVQGAGQIGGRRGHVRRHFHPPSPRGCPPAECRSGARGP